MVGVVSPLLYSLESWLEVKGRNIRHAALHETKPTLCVLAIHIPPQLEKHAPVDYKLHRFYFFFLKSCYSVLPRQVFLLVTQKLQRRNITEYSAVSVVTLLQMTEAYI